MPRQNKPRQVRHEQHIAERIRMERERAGYTYDGLAEKMTEAGCSMAGSAIFKIEKPEPTKPSRRITLNEAATFAEVFGIPLLDLMTPPTVARSERAVELWQQMQSAGRDLAEAGERMDLARDEIVALAEQDPAVEAALEAEFGALVEDLLPQMRAMTQMREARKRHAREVD